MGTFIPLTPPRDPRWQGRSHHKIFIVKNFILPFFILLVAVEYSLYVIWRKTDDPYKNDHPFSFWFRIGLALISDMIYTFVTLVLIFQTPSLSIKSQTLTFHPAVALTFSLVLVSLYTFACFLNVLIVRSQEVSVDDLNARYKIIYVECWFQAILEMCYILMTISSCIAVHQWRVGKKCVREVLLVAVGHNDRHGAIHE